MKNKIYITNDQDKIKTDKALCSLIKKAVNASLNYEKYERDAEISVTLIDNQKIRALNLNYRGVDMPTDVLSFPIFDEEFKDGEPCVLGDIVISLEKAQSQANEYGHSFEREVAFLCVHSMLHLLGYDHEHGQENEREMFEKQEMILNSIGLLRQMPNNN